MVLAAPRTDPATVVTADPGAPATRLACLLDDGSMTLTHEADDRGVATAAGRIGDIPVIAYCTDGTRMGGALGGAGARRIVEAIEAAVQQRCPVIGLWHSGGARIGDGVVGRAPVGRYR